MYDNTASIAETISACNSNVTTFISDHNFSSCSYNVDHFSTTQMPQKKSYENITFSDITIRDMCWIWLRIVAHLLLVITIFLCWSLLHAHLIKLQCISAWISLEVCMDIIHHLPSCHIMVLCMVMHKCQLVFYSYLSCMESSASRVVCVCMCVCVCVCVCVWACVLTRAPHAWPKKSSYDNTFPLYGSSIHNTHMN